MNLPSHLEELRKRLILSAAFVLVAALVCYLFSAQLLHYLILPAKSRLGELVYFSPAGAFMARVNVAVAAGILISSPLILSQLWLFVAPGLTDRERRLVPPLAVATSLLALTGAAFAYWGVLPTTIDFLLGFQTEELRAMISLEEYVKFSVGMVLAFSVAFNLPVIVSALTWAGAVDATFLRSYRRHAYVALAVIAAIITPSPDAISMLMLAVPLIVLYEVSILVSALIGKRKPQNQP